ncbi:MAG: phosphatidylinositol-specific phospholipase C domain-containing protein [Clostridia bacterium]|nr:phosphatidylinositol-specific phospholipase C domain-containing protein [Clostridia bacterium]
MKLGVKITLIVLGAFLLSIILSFAICEGIATRINDKTKPIAELSAWQAQIKDETLLKNVATPGAHDAGSVGMAWFSETQDRDIAGLLACGTRYLDFRIKVKDGEARMFHGPAVSLYLKDMLRDVRDFLVANPSEAVILDFQKFAKDDAKGATLELIDEYLADKLIVNDTEKSDIEFVDTLTLGEARGKCIVFWGVIDGTSLSDKFFLRNNDKGNRFEGCMASLQSYYTRSWNWYYSSKDYIKKALPAYIQMYSELNNGQGLFVLQGQLTDGALVFGPRYREACHEKNMNAYVYGLAENENLATINIIIRDFISPSKNAYTLRLNLAKGIVKDECIETYENMIGTYIH